MNVELTEEQESVKLAARDFAKTELLPGVIERDEKQEFPAAQKKKLGEFVFGVYLVPQCLYSFFNHNFPKSSSRTVSGTCRLRGDIK